MDISISLWELIKRELQLALQGLSENAESLKVVIKSTGVMLSRKGRSRNWQLQADDKA
jgi:hypothetical protein